MQIKLIRRNCDHGGRYNFQSYEAPNFETVDQFHKKLHIFVYQSLQSQTAIKLFRIIDFDILILIYMYAS